jgi:hypothetical protein
VHFYLLSRRTFPYIIFLFLHIFDYVVIDSEHREVSDYVRGFDPKDT